MDLKSTTVAVAPAAASPVAAAARRAFCFEIQLQGDKAPEWIQLFPAGPDLEARDGRKWRLSDPQAVARLTDARRGSTDLPLDWEHAQVHKAAAGERADSAGWIQEVAVRGGLLMGRIDWTQQGRASVESKAYRYVSPLFNHETKIGGGNLDGGEVRAVLGAGLVGMPAFDMPALTATLGGTMSERLKKILAALSLAADATAEQAVAAIETLRTERNNAVAAAAAPSLANFVPRADYDAAKSRADTAEAKVAELEGASLEADIKRELDAAQEAGKITPATRSYHAARCREEGGLEDFREFVKAAPKIAEPSRISGSPPDGSTATGFASAEEAAVAAALNRDAAFLDKHAPRQGAN